MSLIRDVKNITANMEARGGGVLDIELLKPVGSNQRLLPVEGFF